MKHDYAALIEQIAEMEAQLQEAARDKRMLEHAVKREKTLAAKFENQAKTMQALNLGIFTMLDASQIYSLSCESIVYRLGWDSAFVVALRASRPVVLASFQATQKQIGHIHDYLGSNTAFAEAYANRNSISTYERSDRHSLSLRSLFQTDEVVATPIIFGQHLYSYLVVCSHTKRGGKRTPEDLEFLAATAAQIGHAIQNSYAFRNLEEQNAKLRQLDELKNSFISITSHQLRTPLSIVKWILSILEDDAELKKHENQMKLIEQAYESNERLIHVVNDLLNVSRIQDGHLPYNPQLTDLRSMLQDLYNAAKRISESKHLSLESRIDEKIPLVELDPLLFKEAVQNLVDNAIDYNQEGGFIRISAEVDEKAREVVIEVANSGMGIPKDEQRKIFDQFYRSPEAVKIQPNGNGLGLYLTRAIVREHGGDVVCKSEVGKETVFTVRVPLPKIES